MEEAKKEVAKQYEEIHAKLHQLIGKMSQDFGISSFEEQKLLL